LSRGCIELAGETQVSFAYLGHPDSGRTPAFVEDVGRVGLRYA